MAGKGRSTSQQACAACKYRRRKCAEACALAPYFPADQEETFRNAQRLFGVCRIQKMLRQADKDKREDVMVSIKYESNMRAEYPVHGCRGVVCHLQSQIQQVMQELTLVNKQLALCKDHSDGLLTNGNGDNSVDNARLSNNDIVGSKCIYGEIN
ncbi:LOB domain-containing protein 22 [Ricinus communis]|nr:LOB domain-containing protein 22 [Ricinus communis]